MRGAKDLDRKRVRLLIDATTKGGVTFKRGDTGTFRKVGVVRCTFTRDDGEALAVGHFKREDFALAAPVKSKPKSRAGRGVELEWDPAGHEVARQKAGLPSLLD